jgi:hypothetical protein
MLQLELIDDVAVVHTSWLLDGQSIELVTDPGVSVIRYKESHGQPEEDFHAWWPWTVLIQGSRIWPYRSDDLVRSLLDGDREDRPYPSISITPSSWLSNADSNYSGICSA